MNNQRLVILLFCMFLICATPAHSTPTAQKSKRPRSSSTTSIEVCNLLTSAEIQAVLGEAARQTKSSTQPGGGLLMSQCFFGMAGSAKSVSLALARANPTDQSKLTPRAFWRKQFHSEQPREKEKEVHAGKAADRSEAEREEELRKARAITGLGEEAYWVGNPILGALYVLQGDMFLRISVGGIRQEPERIEKSKALAKAALKRL
ncbi:MAG TPA: hypothetical protein VHA33_10395 [Candidatus Angelobacter sp.]|jgi:hypothetical protein|nr:hypothetical protein [Candidatus Angelobacter sp.]